MATCFASDAVSIKAALDYMTSKNGQKRDADKVLATGVECSPETANAEMAAMRKFYGQDCGLKAHTYLQSFSPEDMQGGLTMQQANEVGRETLERFMAARGYAAGSYQAVVCTQCDGDSALIHNHFIVNNIDLSTGRKLKMNQALWDFRAASDQQCRAHGLSIVGKREQGRGCDVRYTGTEKAMLQKGKTPWKEQLRLVLEAEMPLSRNADELRTRLAVRGIGMELRGKKSVVYTIEGSDGKMRRARGRVLGDQYDRAAIDGLGRSYDGRAAELHANWASVVAAHSEMKADARRVARRAVVVCDDAAARAGYRVPQRRRKRAQNGQASAEARAMSACAFLVQDGVAMPLRLAGQAMRMVGRVAGAVPVVGAPVRLVLCGAGGATENVGERMENGARQFRQNVRELDARTARDRRPEECGHGGGGGAAGQQDARQRDGRGLVQDALAEIAKSRGLPPAAVRLDGDDDDSGLRNWELMSELERDEIRNRELARSI